MSTLTGGVRTQFGRTIFFFFHYYHYYLFIVGDRYRTGTRILVLITCARNRTLLITVRAFTLYDDLLLFLIVPFLRSCAMLRCRRFATNDPRVDVCVVVVPAFSARLKHRHPSSKSVQSTVDFRPIFRPETVQTTVVVFPVDRREKY